MTMFKSFLIFLYFLLYLFESTVFGFSTHSTTIFRSFDKDEAVVGESIVVTVSFVNEDAYELRGFYYAEQIPDGLSVNTISVQIDGSTISNYVSEPGSSGDVYPDFVPYRWVFETPTIFLQKTIPSLPVPLWRLSILFPHHKRALLAWMNLIGSGTIKML